MDLEFTDKQSGAKVDRTFFNGKKVLVMGLGQFGGGVDAAEFAYSSGAKITVTDLAGRTQLKESIEQLKNLEKIVYHLDGHLISDFEQANIVIANPAVPGDNEFLQIARNNNKLVTTAINIFFESAPATIIGITGSNGKSTTAALTAHLLGCAKRESNKEKQSLSYRNVWLSGNIGNQPLLGLLDKIEKGDLVVLELSSFQLEQLAEIGKAPNVALLTNLTPNHLDRHKSFENYCAAKENIFKFQPLDGSFPAVSVFNSEDKIAKKWYEKYSGRKGRVCIKYCTEDVSDEIRKVFALPGRVNLSNLAGAVAIARFFEVTDDAIKKYLPAFEPLAHRLELVGQVDGVRWYNDSVATTPQSTMAALQAFEEPIILIAGGYDKGICFDELGKKIAEIAKAVILIGRTADKIAKSIEKNSATENTDGTEKKIRIEFAGSMGDAVVSAKKIAVGGDVVLLSPACASYDMFDNYRQRGKEFVRLVNFLGKEK